MHYHLYILIIISTIHLGFGIWLSQVCNYFHNLTVEVRLTNTEHYSSVVEGCFEFRTLFRTDISGIYVYWQRIPWLGKNAVSDLMELETFVLSNVELEVLDPQAFGSLPKLFTLEISSNNIENISQGVFDSIPSIRRLSMSNNNIVRISSHAFAKLNFLREVELDNNLLEYWDTKWFENCTNLKELDLSNNKISIIPRGTFETLTKMRRIYLSGNKIATIESGAFLGVKRTDLYLARNRLTHINEKAFPRDIKIGTLVISGNYLNFLSDEFLENISFDMISLDYNPWDCYCLFKIYRWITTTNSTLITWNCESSFVPVCAHPGNNSQTCRGYVDENLTSRYIGFLKNLSEPINEDCAMLD